MSQSSGGEEVVFRGSEAPENLSDDCLVGDCLRCPWAACLHTCHRGDWRRFAACRGVGPDVFYVERGESTDDAKRLCRGCPVRKECLEAGLSESLNLGIWGGTAPRERQRLRRDAS